MLDDRSGISALRLPIVDGGALGQATSSTPNLTNGTNSKGSGGTSGIAGLRLLAGRTHGPLQSKTPLPDYTRGQIVLKFILAQMQNNPSSTVAVGIRATLAASLALKKIDPLADAPPLLIDPIGFEAWELYQAAKVEFLAMVVNKVGPWDFKSKIQAMLSPAIIGKKYLPVLTGDAWFPIPGIPIYEFYYDIWSNIHYGYVGRSIGFQEGTLLYYANLAEVAGPAKGIVSKVTGVNDDGDDISTIVGFDLWKSQPESKSLQASDIVQAIAKRVPDWGKVKDHSCKWRTGGNNM